mgnify:CR=1 FL=1
MKRIVKRVTISLDEETHKELTDWMAKKRIFNYSEAIRKIIKEYLKGEREHD